MHFRDAPERVFGSRAKIRLLRTLYNMKEEELTGREIARRCRLTPARTHAVLKEFAGEGLVRMRILGRNHMYTFNPASILMPSVRLIFDAAHSAESQLQKIASEELADRRVLSAWTYGERPSGSDPTSRPLRIMIIVDSEAARGSLSRRSESLKQKIHLGFGETPEIRLEAVEQLRSLAQKGDPEVKRALENHVLLVGESPQVLTSNKWRSQRFRFSLFRRS